MKTTIKLGGGKAVIVQPGSKAGVLVEFMFGGVSVGRDELTPDQCGALMFGIEQALEVAGVAQDRAAASFWKPV